MSAAGEWVVAVVDVEDRRGTRAREEPAEFLGRPDADVVPLYGPHWNPGEHRDLELVNVESGEIRTVLTNEASREISGVDRQDVRRAADVDFLSRPQSDGRRCSSRWPRRETAIRAAKAPAGGRARSATARGPALLFLIAVGPSVVASRLEDDRRDAEPADPHGVGAVERLPVCPTAAPAILPRAPTERSWSPTARWSVSAGPETTGHRVMDIRGNDHVIIHKFDNSHGAASWRSRTAPGVQRRRRRIYFNVSSGPWTSFTSPNAAASRGHCAGRSASTSIS